MDDVAAALRMMTRLLPIYPPIHLPTQWKSIVVDDDDDDDDDDGGDDDDDDDEGIWKDGKNYE